jgi:hypothetical protein
MINCFPTATPATNGKVCRNPKRAPVASMAIFAGPGVPICETAKIMKLPRAIPIFASQKMKKEPAFADPLFFV